MQPKASYHDKVLSSKSTYTTTSIAKELGMSAIALNRILHKKHVQYKQDKTWVLYSNYQSLGYTETQTFTKELKDGTIHTYINTKWTERGRRFIHSVLNPALQLPFSELKMPSVTSSKHYLDMTQKEFNEFMEDNLKAMFNTDDDLLIQQVSVQMLRMSVDRNRKKVREQS